MKFNKKHKLFWLLIFSFVLTSSCTRVISRIQYKQMFKKVDLLPDTIQITKIEKVDEFLNLELNFSIPPKFLPFHSLIHFQPMIYDSDIACKLKTMTWQGQYVEDDAFMVDYKKGTDIWYYANVPYKNCIGKDLKINVLVIKDSDKFCWNYLKIIHVENFREYCDTIN